MNWGNKLLVTFLVFGTGMTFLVYRSMSTNFELVEKDYYKTELQYQSTIDASRLYNTLDSGLLVEQEFDQLLLKFPVKKSSDITSGNLLFYCAYQASNDRKFPIELAEDGTMVIPYHLLERGNYTMKATWVAGGNEFHTEKQVSIRK